MDHHSNVRMRHVVASEHCSSFALQEGVQNRSTQTVWEDVVSSIHDSIVRDKLPKSWAGAEWWVQVAVQNSPSACGVPGLLLDWERALDNLWCVACHHDRWCTAQISDLDDYLQVYEPGKGLAFHFDKDEHAMKEKHQMIQPVLSSVLYLTGDCTTERLGKEDLRAGNCQDCPEYFAVSGFSALQFVAAQHVQRF